MMGGPAGISHHTATKAEDFSISYHKTYKVVRNLPAGLSYILRHCGTPEELSDIHERSGGHPLAIHALAIACREAESPQEVLGRKKFLRLGDVANIERLRARILSVIGTFGFYNRVNDTLATELESSPLQTANRLLRKHGWDAGKHAKATAE